MVGTDEPCRDEEGGRQAMLGQDPRRRQVVEVAIVEGDGHGSRRQWPTTARQTKDFFQRDDAETLRQHPTDGAELLTTDCQSVFGNLIRHAMKQQHHEEGLAA
jgi:hypothetical protein